MVPYYSNTTPTRGRGVMQIVEVNSRKDGVRHRRKVGELVISECKRSVIHGSLVAFAARKQRQEAE